MVLALTLALIPLGCAKSKRDAVVPTGRPQVQAGPTISQHAADAADTANVVEDSADTPVSVLRINGEAITVDDILNPIREELDAKSRTMTADAYHRYLVDRLTRQVRSEARDRLLYQEASKGITDQEQEKFDEFVDAQVRETVNSEYQGRQTRYEKALARKGKSIQDDRERIRRELIVRRYLFQRVARRVAEPTRRELWQYFQDNRASMTVPPRREMLLIEITKAAPLDVTAHDGSSRPIDACDAIRLAYGELEGGADFGDVAGKYSTGLHANDGGNWGLVTRDGLRERWQPAVKALFELDAGQFSDIIETDEAYFIVQCGQIEPGRDPDFAAIQPELVNRYRDHQFNLLIEEHVADLQEKATIEPQNIGRFLRAVLEAAPPAAGS